MYDRDYTRAVREGTLTKTESDDHIVDRREMLRVKLKTLAAEARIIRAERRKTFGALAQRLNEHNHTVVRRAARETHLAYGFIRGRRYDQMERYAYSVPNWSAVWKMIRKYGPPVREDDFWDWVQATPPHLSHPSRDLPAGSHAA